MHQHFENSEWHETWATEFLVDRNCFLLILCKIIPIHDSVMTVNHRRVDLLQFFLKGGGSVHRVESDKSRYFAITEFSNCFIIWSTCISLGSKAICHFHARRKAWVLLCMSRILFAAKHQSQTQLDNVAHSSRPLFVGSYLQVTWWARGQWKERKICLKWC